MKIFYPTSVGFFTTTNMILRVLLFLVINFGALAIGSLFTSDGVASDWYQNLDKAPWTPPGWSFGVAWSTIMICFSFYMAYLWSAIDCKRSLFIAYVIQLVLNIGWNPVFFYFNYSFFGLIIISLLTITVFYLLYTFYSNLKAKSILILPYVIWLLIATSLNAYIVIKN